MTHWKSPRCSQACWDEIKQHDAKRAKIVMALADMTRDRDEWKHQHENLLAMYQASHIPDEPQAAPVPFAEMLDGKYYHRLRAETGTAHIMHEALDDVRQSGQLSVQQRVLSKPSDPLVDLVFRFSAALLEKLRAAEAKYGRKDDWLDPNWEADCQRQLLEHVAKGDPRDVAAYAAFCWHHGWTTSTLSSHQQGTENG